VRFWFNIITNNFRREMMIVDVGKKVIKLKVVYYGPTLSGKTTNLEKLSALSGLKLMKIDTKGDRTLVFDFSTKTVQVGDMTASFALYTIPGHEIYKDIRVTVLRGVDGVVFVADAQEHRLNENIEFFDLLKKDLLRVDKRYEDVPVVIQYNKMDLPNVLPFEVLEEKINKDKLPSVCAIAIKGEGVLETFNLLEGLLLSKLERMIG
jgi:signal recognition particle receptor subunit beta